MESTVGCSIHFLVGFHGRRERRRGEPSLTRGEPRLVHITLIATCRVYNSVVVIRRITPGLFPGHENPTDGFLGEAVLMMELPRRHSTPSEGGRFAPIKISDYGGRPLTGPRPDDLSELGLVE
jgi:hypothetical protein